LDRSKKKRLLRQSLKIIFSVAGVVFVLSKIDWQNTKESLKSADFVWLIFALFCFNFSQLLSAFRLKQFFDSLQVNLSPKNNIILYYKGMLYNLLLPGGIGGDAYKIYYIRKRNEVRTKRLIKAVFLDRLSGLIAMIILIFLFLYFTKLGSDLTLILVMGILLIYPSFFLFWNQLFKKFKRRFFQINLLALLVQLFQVIAVIFIMLGLEVKDNYLIYLIIFLVSSIATVIPITIGGLGIRELVFFYAASVFRFDQGLSVSISLLFFFITLLSSLAGIFLKAEEKNPKVKLPQLLL